MNRIKELPKSSSHLLSCTQVITSVKSAVKELLENALDSHATSVEIKLENFGFDKIEVKDNGSGILKDDIHFVAKPHCTSKIASHLDLVKIDSYGFRGEAVAALCAVADLAITTRTANEDFGYTYAFDHKGNILTSNPCPCNQGTSVVVTNLFHNLPVRKQLYRSEKKKKEELKSIQDILIAFGCILMKIKFVLYHNQTLIWQKSVVDRTIDGLLLSLGNVANYMENCEYVNKEAQIKIEVFLPKHNASSTYGQTTSNRSIVSINKRPVRMKYIDKLLKEYYSKSLGAGHKPCYPICFVSIEVPTTDIDINYEPNKTAVLLHNMDIILEQLSKLLSSFYNTGSDIETKINAKTATYGVPPVPAEDKVTKISSTHVICNNVDKENGTVLFNLNQTPNADRIQDDKRKGSNVLSKKLSRKNEFLTPSNKKTKTSSFSTPPNDIYKHINTLGAFFSSDSKSSNDKATSNNSSINEANVEKSKKIGANFQDSSIRNEDIFPDQSTMIVQQKNINANDDFLVSDSFGEILSKNTVEKSVENNSIFRDSSELLIHPNGMNKHDCSNTSDSNQTEDLNVKEISKDPFISALSMLGQKRDQDLLLVETNKNTTTIDARPQEPVTSNFNLGSADSDPLTVGEWSRGQHPVKNVQPVTVLKPKVFRTDTKTDETSCNPDLDCTGVQEPCVVSMFQRKITPFDFFCRKHRLEVASLNPELNNQQIAGILSEKWNRLPPEEKAIYKNMVSKDYPKTIKNKDKLGKIVGENINKMKNNSTNSKKITPKKKRKRQEINISFNMQLFLQSSLNSSIEMEGDNSFKVFNCLAPGIWICSQKSKIYVLNCHRLQEAIIYFRLLETYEFEAEFLQSSFILSSSSLGNDALDVILKMDVINEYGNLYISDKRLLSNGFKMKILQGNNNIQLELIGMTNMMAFYGVSDLKEILHLIKEKGFNAKLSDCRPGKAIMYLQGEAVRITRQSPASNKIEDIENLLKEMNSLPSQTCIHSKPFLQELYDLKAIHCQ